MSADDELMIKVGADIKGFQKKMEDIAKGAETAGKKSKKAFKGLRSVFNRISKSAAKIGKNMLRLAAKFGPLIGAVLGAVGIMKTYAGINEAFARKDSLGKTADKLGIATEALAGLNLQAEKAGTTAGNMENSILRMNRSLSEAAEGTGEAVGQFEKMNLSASELIKLAPDKAFALIADEVMKLDTVADRTAATMDIFGRSGAGLMKVMEGGSEAIKASRKEAEELGIALSRIDIVRAEVVNDEFTSMQKAMEGVYNVLSRELEPAFFALARVTKEFFINTRKNKDVMQFFGDVAMKVVGFIAKAFRGFLVVVEAVKVAVTGIQLAFLRIVPVVFNVITDIISRAQGLRDVFMNIMDNPTEVFKLAWEKIKIVVGVAMLWIKKQVASTIRSIGDSLSDIGWGFDVLGKKMIDTSKGMERSIIGAAWGIAKANANLDMLILNSDGLSKLKDGFDKVTASFDASKAKKLGMSWMDGISFGFLGDIGSLTKTLEERLIALGEKAGLFGSQTMSEFISGMRKALEESTAIGIDALIDQNADPDNQGGDEFIGPEASPEVLRAQAVSEEISRINNERDDNEASISDAAKIRWATDQQFRLSTYSNMLGNMAALMQGKSRKMFEIGKVAAMGQAGVDMYASINKTLASVPYPWNVAAATSVGIMGAMNIQRIQSQSFGGGGAKGVTSAPAGGGGAIGGGGDPQTITRQTSVNINLQGNSFGQGGIRSLINEINEATEDNTTLVVN